MLHYKIRVSGLVQGVSFRAFTQNIANQYHIVGSVKNLDDGRVEIIASGDENNMQAFIHECNKGPVFASVKQVDITELTGNSDFSEFVVLYN